MSALDDVHLRFLLVEFKWWEWARALNGARADVVEKVLRNVSSRVAEDLRHDIPRAGGPCQWMRRRIVDVALAYDSRGLIRLPRSLFGEP